MSEKRRTSRWALGTEFGCASALALAAFASFPMFFAMAWGGAHCEPVPQCQEAIERIFFDKFAYVLTASVVLGVLVRTLIIGWWGRSTVDHMPSAEKGGATALTLAVTTFAIALAYLLLTPSA